LPVCCCMLVQEKGLHVTRSCRAFARCPPPHTNVACVTQHMPMPSCRAFPSAPQVMAAGRAESHFSLVHRTAALRKDGTARWPQDLPYRIVPWLTCLVLVLRVSHAAHRGGYGLTVRWRKTNAGCILPCERCCEVKSLLWT
jgi:hypothetical protein